MTRAFWKQTGGTLVEEFPVVKAGKGHARRLIDGIIILNGPMKIAKPSEVATAIYLEQLTFLLFLKMADEYSRPPYSRDLKMAAGANSPGFRIQKKAKALRAFAFKTS